MADLHLLSPRGLPRQRRLRGDQDASRRPDVGLLVCDTPADGGGGVHDQQGVSPPR